MQVIPVKESLGKRLRRLRVERGLPQRITRRTAAAVIGFLAVLAVVAGLYASGPEYIVKSGGLVSVLCIDGKVANFVWAPAPLGFCVDKRDGTYRPRAELVRHTNAFERLYYAVVSSKDTR